MFKKIIEQTDRLIDTISIHIPLFKHIKQLGVFAFVGLSATFACSMLYLLLCRYGVYPVIANIIGFFCGTIISFIGHFKITFNAGRYKNIYLIKFILLCCLSLAINTSYVLILVNYLNYPSYIAVYPMIFVTPWVNFILSKLWVFANKSS